MVANNCNQFLWIKFCGIFLEWKTHSKNFCDVAISSLNRYGEVDWALVFKIPAKVIKTWRRMILYINIKHMIHIMIFCDKNYCIKIENKAVPERITSERNALNLLYLYGSTCLTLWALFSNLVKQGAQHIFLKYGFNTKYPKRMARRPQRCQRSDSQGYYILFLVEV